jgi:hypothetical protein
LRSTPRSFSLRPGRTGHSFVVVEEFNLYRRIFGAALLPDLKTTSKASFAKIIQTLKHRTMTLSELEKRTFPSSDSNANNDPKLLFNSTVAPLTFCPPALHGSVQFRGPMRNPMTRQARNGHNYD